MFTVIRTYSGNRDLANELVKRSADVEKIIGAVQGFIAWYLIRTTDGTTTVTVCETSAGCDESTRRAGEWLRENLPNLKIGAPQVVEGELVHRFAHYKASQV